MSIETMTQEELAKALAEPFDPSEVDFRVQGKPNETSGRAQVVAYIDARAVQDRLDKVVGPLNWGFDWAPLVIVEGEVMVAKGTLTVLGVSKSDAGSASNFEQTLGAVSHCFKRAAVHWGVGRYLYSLPMTWVQVERNGRIPAEVLRELRAKLPRPASSKSAPTTEVLRDESAQASAQSTEAAPAWARAAVGPDMSATASNTPADHRPASKPATRPAPAKSAAPSAATPQQVTAIGKLCKALGKSAPEGVLTFDEAKAYITGLSADYQAMRRSA
jgi:hypothetical protein